jgi:hypothetical protein
MSYNLSYIFDRPIIIHTDKYIDQSDNSSWHVSVFTINFLTYHPGRLVPMEFLQVPSGIYKSPISRQFFQGLDQRLK